MTQTADGYLMLGTEFGLVRFDGIRNVDWAPPTGQRLPSNNIRALLTARDGTLWIGTLEGLASWRDGALRHYPELAGQHVSTLIEDREGTVWAGSFAVPAAKVCEIRRGKAQCYGEDGSLGQWSRSLYEDHSGQIWAGAATGLWRWKPGPPKRYILPQAIDTEQAIVDDETRSGLIVIAERLFHMNDGKTAEYRLPRVRWRFNPLGMLRDRDGGLWIGTLEQGLLHVYRGKADVFSPRDGLSGGRVRCLFEDREGNIWVATGDGLDRFRGLSVFSVSAKQGLSSPSAMSILADHNGAVWIGTAEGLNRWRDQKIEVYRAPGRPERAAPLSWDAMDPGVREITDPGLADNQIGSLFEDNRGRLWVSAFRGISRLENGRFTRVRAAPDGWVNGMTGDATGGIWIGYQDRGLYLLVDDNVVVQLPWDKLGHGVPSVMIPDLTRKGLWLGFFKGGVVHFDGAQIREAYGTKEGLGAGRVMDLRFDAEGVLWAATEAGLSRIEGGRVKTLTRANGLPCDAVHWTVEDKAHFFWVYSPCGLIRISRLEMEAWASQPNRTIQRTVLDVSDGVHLTALLTGYTPRVSQSVDGKIWFAHLDSISVIDPGHLISNDLLPPVHVEQVMADRKVYWQNLPDRSSRFGPVRLPPLIRDLVIDYSALSLIAPEKIRFKYKLEGYDRDWQDPGNRRQAFYSSLPPNKYGFRVIASNNRGIWNETGDTLEFSIAPAYYQTTWFRALLAAAVLTVLWAAYRFRVCLLQRESRQLRDVINTIPAYTWSAGKDGTVDFMNDRWLEFSGFSAQEALGWGWENSIHPEDRDRFVAEWRDAVALGRPMEAEARVRRSDGQYRWLLIRNVPSRDKHGKIIKWYGTSTDIEDLKRAEQEREKLRQLEADLAHINRVDMMGELAASVAHEVNQPLTGIVSNGSACLRWLAGDSPNLEEAREAVRDIVRDGKRAGEVIARIRALTKRAAPPKEKVDLNEVAREVLVLVNDEAKKNSVTIRTEFAEDVWPVLGDRVQLQQVLLNLVMNGMEAMTGLGARERQLSISTRNIDPDQVQVSVQDSGVGLDPNAIARIFEAFYTTKPGGMGMGLSISRSILQNHGGRLWATPNEGPGTTFHFTLPKYHAEEQYGAQAV